MNRTLKFDLPLYNGQSPRVEVVEHCHSAIGFQYYWVKKILDADTLSRVYINIWHRKYSKRDHDHAQASGASPQSRDSGVGSVYCSKANMQSTQYGYSQRMVGLKLSKLRIHR